MALPLRVTPRAVLENCVVQLDILDQAMTIRNDKKKRAPAQEKSRWTNLRRFNQNTAEPISKLLALEWGQSFRLLQKELERIDQIKDAKRQLKNERQFLQRENETLQEKSEKILTMQAQIKELRKVPRVEKIIAKRRLQQRKMSELKRGEINKKNLSIENHLEDEVEALGRQLVDNAKAHEEYKKFLHNQHEELQQKLQQWQESTKRMVQEKKQQLNAVCCKKTVELDRLMEMRRKFKEMEQVVMEGREEQERLWKKEAEARAATKLQAWWRGCMVRRGLGSFKKVEEDKKASKKKKEGKKKKKK